MAELRQAAIVAAKWWTEKIRHPNLNSYCNGDRTSDSSFLTMMMMHTYAMDHEATEEQLDMFCEALSKRINIALDKGQEINIECNYGPCNILGVIADSLNIDIHLFPFKRTMWITSDSVEVKDGCDASVETIYPTKQESNNSEPET